MVSTCLHGSQLVAGSLLGMSDSLPLLYHSPQPLLGHQVDRAGFQLAILHHTGNVTFTSLQHMRLL